jgi:hypothetical protein
MENDAIRSSGTNTLVDIWVDGKLRGVCVSQEAIGAHIGFDRAATMSEDDRREFVRTHLSLVVTAATARLAATDPSAEVVVIDAGQLPRKDGNAGDRRKGERRKRERRKVERPKADLPLGERRRGERRKGERRRSSDRADS